MADVPEWMKAWLEESRKEREEEKQRREEEKRRYEEERLAEKRRYEERQEEEKRRYEERQEEEKRRYEEELRRREEAERHREEERRKEREDDRRRYEELIKSLEGKKHVAIGPESLKLKKLIDTDDIEAYLTTFERAAEAHGVEEEKWSVVLAPQLTGKAQQAFAALSNEDSKSYKKVKEAIFRQYNIN